MNVKISLDTYAYHKKPEKEQISKISTRVAENVRELSVAEAEQFIGNEGYTFCPAIFSNGKRRKDNFRQMQFFVLDFDDGISYREVEARAKELNLPISFAYKTFSWKEGKEKFRVIFLHKMEVCNPVAAEIILALLMGIFKECDKSCKDISRMFFGGKGLLAKHGEVAFDLIQLVAAYECYQYKIRKDYAQVIRAFAGRFHIRLKNDLLDVECLADPGKKAFGNNIYIENAIFPEVYIIHLEEEKRYNTDTQCKSKRTHVEYKKLERCPKLKERCRLYREFVTGKRWLHHDERLFLALNLVYIKSGGMIFKKTIENLYPGQSEKWNLILWYIKKREYLPGRCDKYCPYCEECCHDKNIILSYRIKNRIERIGEPEEYSPLEETYQMVMENIECAMESKQQGIHLIEAQTGIGKTRGYCDILKRQERTEWTIIAVYSNELKHQVYQSLRESGLKARYTPSLKELPLAKDIKEKIEWLYSVGLEEIVKGELEKYISENKESTVTDVIRSVQACKEYCKFDWSEEGHIVTTHQRLLHIPEEGIKGRTVIIDEDILYTIFMNFHTISRETLKKVRENPGELFSFWLRAGEFLGKKAGTYGKLEEGEKGKVNTEELKQLGINENLGAMLEASVFYADEDDITVFCPQKLKKGKYIILSATLNPHLYQQYFMNMPILVYETKQTQYLGKVLQYSYYSLSRISLRDKAEKVFAFVNTLEEKIPIITFQSFGKKNEYDLHFGNTQGLNCFTGKNFAIVGTPHGRMYVYNMLAMYLGEVIDTEPERMEIERNRFRFSFMTFKNQVVREVQLYLIESELEQCIGRARLLRNDATVYVFSNYPCQQAILQQKNYLYQEENIVNEESI